MFGNCAAKEKEALDLQRRKHRDDPQIIAQFSTKCDDLVHDCDCDIYAYKDCFKIRKYGMNVVDQSRDTVYYDEVKNIWIGTPSTRISPGIINIAYEKGTRFYKYCTPEHNKDSRTIEPNEIYFDCYYNSFVEKGIEKINRAIHAYKTEKERKEQEFSASRVFNLNGEFRVENGSLNFGDVSVSVDNSVNKTIFEITNEIYQKGGEDREELFSILLEVQKMLEEMLESKKVPEKKNLFRKIINHADKHGWYYAEIVSLIGTAVMQILGNKM